MVINDYIFYNNYRPPINWGYGSGGFLRKTNQLEATAYDENIYNNYGHTRNLLFVWK